MYVPNPLAEKAWNAIMEAGAPFGIKPAGLACRDTLRLEMGFCLYGNDIDDTHLAHRGRVWAGSPSSPRTSSIHPVLKAQKENGVDTASWSVSN